MVGRSVNGMALGLASVMLLLPLLNPLFLLAPWLSGPATGLQIWMAGGLLPVVAVVSAVQFERDRRYFISWISFAAVTLFHFAGRSHEVIGALR
jgi:hypothetical protein